MAKIWGQMQAGWEAFGNLSMKKGSQYQKIV